jgi:hypothetical protein
LLYAILLVPKICTCFLDFFEKCAHPFVVIPSVYTTPPISNIRQERNKNTLCISENALMQGSGLNRLAKISDK